MLLHRFFRPSQLLALSLVTMLSGCGGTPEGNADRPKVYPVTGVVTLDGNPLEGATVTFSSGSAAPSGFGKSDASGKFSLTTFDANDGAPAGSYQVLVTKTEEAAATGAPSIDSAEYVPPKEIDPNRPAPKPKSLIPEKYGVYGKSGMDATVTADGKNEFKFDLSSK